MHGDRRDRVERDRDDERRLGRAEVDLDQRRQRHDAPRQTATPITALAGTRVADSFDQML